MRRRPAVALRPLLPADAAVFAGWARDEVFRRQAGWEPGKPGDYYVEFHRRIIADPPAELLRLGALDAVTGELVGFVDLHGADPRSRELGYAIGPSSAWGRGLGTAAAAAGIAHGFDVLHLERIWAEAWATNHASVRILEKLSMRETTRGVADERGYRRFEITPRQVRPPVVT